MYNNKIIIKHFREILIGQLEAYLKQMGEELHTNHLKSAKTAPKGKNLSNTMRTIVWITQTENTVQHNKNQSQFL